MASYLPTKRLFVYIYETSMNAILEQMIMSALRFSLNDVVFQVFDDNATDDGQHQDVREDVDSGGADGGQQASGGKTRPKRVLIVTSLTLTSLLGICSIGSVDGNL